MASPTPTICSCLFNLGISSSDCFAGCANLDEEFAVIKKAYFKIVLKIHPDKGGDAATFRDLQNSWNVVRELKDSHQVNPSGFAHYLDGEGSKAQFFSTTQQEASTPSYEWFKAATEELIPYYLIEVAKSGRSTCHAKLRSIACHHKSAEINLGEIRVGMMNLETGDYSRFNHLRCWRVPSRIWKSLPDPGICDSPKLFEDALSSLQQSTLIGFQELSKSHKDQVVAHVMNKSNHARMLKYKDTEPAPISTNKIEKSRGGYFTIAGCTKLEDISAVVNKTALSGKACVLTGTFPELGGGSGLRTGKERLRSLIESFGCKVQSKISGTTDFLVVGKEPGVSKVSDALSRGLVLVDLKGIKETLETPHASLANVHQPLITSFSKGFTGRGFSMLRAARAKAVNAALLKPEDSVSASKKRGQHVLSDSVSDIVIPTLRASSRNRRTLHKVAFNKLTSTTCY